MAPIKNASKDEKTGKIGKAPHSSEPKTRAQKKAAIGHHDEQYKKLEAEREQLRVAQEHDLFTSGDERRLKDIENTLAGYKRTMAQTNKVHTIKADPDSAAIGDSTTRENLEPQGVIGQDVRGQEATTETALSSALDLGKTHVNPYPDVSENRDVKQEYSRLVDDLNMAWDVNINRKHTEPSLQHLKKEVFGHIVRNSQTRCCVRYGSADAYSARFESTLPEGSEYNGTRDVTQRSIRIVERIVQMHRDKKQPLPMNILSQVQVLVVYWDSKMGVGHSAEVDVLAPDFVGRRPHTRCFIYLDPSLYNSYGLENTTGYSHETRSTMKLVMEGNDDWQKSVTFHNIAVRLENKFEEKHMGRVSGRPGPLLELSRERKTTTRRKGSRYSNTELAASPRPVKAPTSPRPSPTPQETRTKQSSAITDSGMSLKEQFHADFLELFDLAKNVAYEDLTEQQQLLYPAQFTKWKAVNA
ncbi:hypothetical protein J3E71DRAFT_362264 [Bipolaris maydis]|nr:hypothetical protein J3E71DRAFT_362264 [Bipolaris maydis]